MSDPEVTSPNIERFQPRAASGADLAAWCAVFSEGHAELSGSARSPAVLAGRLLSEDASGMLRWSARSGSAGPIIGAAELRPQSFAPGVGFLRLFVARPARRRGAGSALLERAARDAATAGVAALQGTLLAGPPGEPFARTYPGLRVLLRLSLEDQRLDREAVLARCRELSACPDRSYTVVHWEGAAPEQLAASFARVMDRLLDAPGAELQVAPRAWDIAAVRAWEAQSTADGEHLMVSAAVHDVSSEIVAATVATVPAAGGPVADQHDTVVLTDHRRRGLARWIKAGQALRIHELFPRVQAITVTVNQRNTPINRVNHALGYTRVAERLLVQAATAPGAQA